MSQDATSKLASAISPLMSQQTEIIKDRMAVQTQEILMVLREIEVRQGVLEKLLTENSKKKIVRDSKKADTDPAAEDTPPPKKVHGNAMIYFKEQYKTSPEFRERVTDERLRAVFNNDETIKSKSKPEQKIAAEATVAWNWLGSNNDALKKEITKEYNDTKTAVTAKPAQQVAELNTPPGEKA